MTRNTTESVDAFFATIGEEWRACFDVLLTRDNTPFVKPDPRSLLHFSQVRLTGCWGAGWGEGGVLPRKAAGMLHCFHRGWRSEAELFRGRAWCSLVLIPAHSCPRPADLGPAAL